MIFFRDMRKSAVLKIQFQKSEISQSDEVILMQFFYFNIGAMPSNNGFTYIMYVFNLCLIINNCFIALERLNIQEKYVSLCVYLSIYSP